MPELELPQPEYSHILHSVPQSDTIPMGDTMHAMPVRWIIRPLLERHGLSAYRLMKESGLARGTVYRLVNGETTTLNVETLDKIMTALRRLTNERIGIDDLIEYEEPR